MFKWEVFMPRRKNSKGYCDKRSVDVFELNLCDYYKCKRKSLKPLCRNCVHFHIDVPDKPENTVKKQITEDDV